MNAFFQKYKNILIGIILIVLLAWGYSTFFAGSNEASLTVQTVSNEESNELVTTLLELQSLTLDERLFESSVFQGFVDFSRPILPEPSGRENPFAPIGVGGDPIDRSPQVATPPASSTVDDTTLDNSLDGLDDINFDDLLF